MRTEVAATICFMCAVLHTFIANIFHQLALRSAPGSVGRVLFHILGEVELVFGIWAAIYLVGLSVTRGIAEPLNYLASLSFTEPVFVFVVMAICSTQVILRAATLGIEYLAIWIPLSRPVAFYLVALTVGPWLGSLITEPAAMTVTALILLDRYFGAGLSLKFRYATVGLLFVNISVGGTLTHFAAPPVLMVASRWNWDTLYMLEHFGYKAILACLLSTSLVIALFYKELSVVAMAPQSEARLKAWKLWIHLVILTAIVFSAHHTPALAGLFLLFWMVTKMSRKKAKLREAAFVALFLVGIVILGPPQRWWLEPLLAQLDSLQLYLGAMGLTAITDNAALTFLGAQVPSLIGPSQYALVAGAVVGGGLTVIANAPNPAGYGILNGSFGAEGIRPFRLFLSAVPPTLVAALCFWLL